MRVQCGLPPEQGNPVISPRDTITAAIKAAVEGNVASFYPCECLEHESGYEHFVAQLTPSLLAALGEHHAIVELPEAQVWHKGAKYWRAGGTTATVESDGTAFVHACDNWPVCGNHAIDPATPGPANAPRRAHDR